MGQLKRPISITFLFILWYEIKTKLSLFDQFTSFPGTIVLFINGPWQGWPLQSVSMSSYLLISKISPHSTPVPYLHISSLLNFSPVSRGHFYTRRNIVRNNVHVMIIERNTLLYSDGIVKEYSYGWIMCKELL